MEDPRLLVVSDLKTHFYSLEGTVQAVDGLDFWINRGETLGLVGESGCGKTVASLSILRLVPAPGKIVSGQILFEEDDLLRKTEHEMRKIRGSRISMIFQDPTAALNPVLTVGDQIAETIVLHQKTNRREAKRRTLEMFKLARLSDPEAMMSKYSFELSGGMQQRIMIALAMSCGPALLIADEPTTALDVTIQAQILELVKELKKKVGMSILLISHNLGVVAELCDRIAVMYAGNIVEMGSILTIFRKHSHPYTQGLIGMSRHRTKEEGRLSVIPGNVPDMINPPSGCRFHPRCPHAMPVCSEHTPEMTELQKEHLVACYLYA
jgi:oligopeptide/dipeptide ABC transporter ATP-binding protein